MLRWLGLAAALVGRRAQYLGLADDGKLEIKSGLVIEITSAGRSMDDKRGSRLPLSISDKCCGRMGHIRPTLSDSVFSVRRR